MFRRIGVTLTYSHSDTKNQILPVSIPSATGFGSQWQNAGTLTNKTWELSVNVPLVHTRDLNWSWRFNYDRTRTVITKLDVPPFRIGTTPAGRDGHHQHRRGRAVRDDVRPLHAARRGRLRQAAGARSRPPAAGDGAQFQVNSDGWLVWTGGYGIGETASPGTCG